MDLEFISSQHIFGRSLFGDYWKLPPLIFTNNSRTLFANHRLRSRVGNTCYGQARASVIRSRAKSKDREPYYYLSHNNDNNTPSTPQHLVSSEPIQS